MKLYTLPKDISWANAFGNEPVRRVKLPAWARIPSSPKRGRTTKKASPKRASSRSSTRSRMRAEMKSPSPPKPKEGTLKRTGNSYQIYKKGAWEAFDKEVFNAEGAYGGPYADMRNLQANPDYIAAMQAKYPGQNWKEADRKARRAAKVAAKAAAAAKGGTRRRSSRRRS
jgi:hypothetical protein